MKLHAETSSTPKTGPPGGDLPPVQVLLVEDNPGDARLIREFIRETGSRNFQVECIGRLAGAVARLSEGGIQLVLLDLSLPDSRGLETFQSIHAAAPHVPVIVLTGLNDESLALQAVHEGAQDYLMKGQGDGPLLVRAMRYALERAHTAAQLSAYAEELRTRNAQLEEDLHLAREFQLLCLPAQYPVFPAGTPPDQSALQFHHLYRPATSVGGDFFSVFAWSDTTAAVFLCDVMGHGLRAAFITAVLRGLVEELKTHTTDPGVFLAALNHSLHAILRRTDETIIATAVLITADVATGEGRFANAGHPSPFHLQRRAGRLVELRDHDSRHGPALGLFADATFPTCRFPADPGDALMLFTDGLHEAEGSGGGEFGLERMRDFVRDRLAMPTAKLFAELLAEAGSFAGGKPFEDDVCLVGMDIALTNPPARAE
ncbi:MAG: phosphoserine phosphatase RsbU/P [Verrucomicrobiota bacterium]|jgi:sigma-B regulation protein RsbU (phosphoserine phosphatase)